MMKKEAHTVCENGLPCRNSPSLRRVTGTAERLDRKTAAFIGAEETKRYGQQVRTTDVRHRPGAMVASI
jgi:hypothetical protein